MYTIVKTKRIDTVFPIIFLETTNVMQMC